MEKVFDLHFEIGSLACTVVGISPYQTQSSGRAYYEHHHHHFELLCVAQGSCTYQCGRETVTMDPGRMLLFPPQRYHKEILSSPDCVRMSLSFQLSRPADSTDRESSLFYEAFTRISQPVLIPQQELSKKDLSQISDFAAAPSPDLLLRERLKIACHSFLLTLYDQLPAQTSRESGKSQTAPPSIAYVIDNYFALHFSAKGSQEELAAHLHVSPRQLQRLLLRHYGKTYRQLQKEIRLQVARGFLEDPDKSIAEISELMGYSSPENFATFIKKETGLTPVQLRRSMT